MGWSCAEGIGNEEVGVDMKLFKVTCRGLSDRHFEAYAVANDSHTAYQMVRDSLEQRSIGFDKERELKSVELIADDTEYPECERRLYLQNKSPLS